MMKKIAALIDKLASERIRGQFRHMLSAAGPLLAARGVTNNATWEIIIGSLIAGLAFWDSWRRK